MYYSPEISLQILAEAPTALWRVIGANCAIALRKWQSAGSRRTLRAFLNRPLIGTCTSTCSHVIFHTRKSCLFLLPTMSNFNLNPGCLTVEEKSTSNFLQCLLFLLFTCCWFSRHQWMIFITILVFEPFAIKNLEHSKIILYFTFSNLTKYETISALKITVKFIRFATSKN